MSVLATVGTTGSHRITAGTFETRFESPQHGSRRQYGVVQRRAAQTEALADDVERRDDRQIAARPAAMTTKTTRPKNRKQRPFHFGEREHRDRVARIASRTAAAAIATSGSESSAEPAYERATEHDERAKDEAAIEHEPEAIRWAALKRYSEGQPENCAGEDRRHDDESAKAQGSTSAGDEMGEGNSTRHTDQHVLRVSHWSHGATDVSRRAQQRAETAAAEGRAAERRRSRGA